MCSHPYQRPDLDSTICQRKNRSSASCFRTKVSYLCAVCRLLTPLLLLMVVTQSSCCRWSGFLKMEAFSVAQEFPMPNTMFTFSQQDQSTDWRSPNRTLPPWKKFALEVRSSVVFKCTKTWMKLYKIQISSWSSTLAAMFRPPLHWPNDKDCGRPYMRTATKIGDCSFFVADPLAWNSLPSDIRWTPETISIKRHLKTYFLKPIF